jgi:hypothetical protein
MTKIFESPDDGDTVFIREFGSVARELYAETESKTQLIESLKEDKLWGEIRRAAETNPTLQDALDAVKVIYQLIKKHNS